MVRQKQAFTLVELIVVITILAILGTIAFISLQGYSAQSRDSVRITDMSSIKTGLELFNLESGKYPLPSDETIITYSGATAWTQGYFGEQTKKNIDKLDKIPTDPLTDKKYVYSTTSTRQEYQLAGAMEGDDVSYRPPLTPPYQGGEQAQAVEKTARLKISGSYNGKLLKVSTGSTDYVLAIPSIMSISGTTLESIITNNYLAYNGYKNLPFQYEGTYKTQGETNLKLVNSSNLVVFIGDLNLLSKTDASGQTARSELMSNLQNAYRGTEIQGIKEIQDLLTVGGRDTEKLSTSIVSHILGGSILAGSENPTGWTALDSNCDIPDITIGSQTWAGCNSTLGTGVEWGKRDNGTNGTVGTCYDYDGNNTAMCTIGSSVMASNTKANTWYMGTNANGDQEYSAIWGKFYTWANSSSACPTGRHLPSDAEWETLETTLNGSNCRNATSDWLCSGLGWLSHNMKTDTSNLANRLKIPLAGYRNTDGSTFFHRGSIAYLWSSSAFDATTAYTRLLHYGNATVYRYNDSKIHGFNVRCLKD